NSPNNTEASSVDNDLSTKWSNLGLGSWLQFDLGQEKQICDIGISWYKGNLRYIDFLVSVSSDGYDFRQVFSSTNTYTTDDIEVYDIPDTVGKYLRITVTGNSVNDWASINEVDVFANSIQKESLTSASLINIVTQVINDNGGTNETKDFIISVNGNQATPNSFSGNPDGQSVSLQPGTYEVKINNFSGYKTTLSAGCKGIIGSGDNLECVITFDDINPATPSNELLNTIDNQTSNNLTSNNLTSNNLTSNNLTTTIATTNKNLNNSNNNNNANVNLLLRDLDLNVLLEVINVHGGSKKPLDFIITVKGENVEPNSFAGSNNFQKVSIKPGNYDVKISDTFGYEINRISGCTGVIERTDKTCIIELIDTPKLLDTTQRNNISENITQ
ncbi:MAG: discoidin domain-containing protein, partial [Nitrososphaeraceae archaeon]